MSIQHWQFELGGGVSIELRAKGDIAINDTPELRLSLQAHLPGYSPQALGVPNLFIGLCQREDDEEGWAVRRGKNREYVIINSRFDDSLQKDLPHILYHAARIEWLKRGIFPAHAACVGTEEEGYVLIMGPSGAGKTSATLECAQGWGLEVFSGDKTLLFPTSETSLIALSGTQVLTTRGADHEAWGDLIKSSTPLGGRHAVVIDDVWKSESPFVRIKGIVMLALGHDHQDVWERIDQPMYSL
ncbi:MAG: hypothetical protein KDK78_11740, partial [Chlamydiia bacterium]|nr:hypothetical protein [Chlamydiia bacterium]